MPAKSRKRRSTTNTYETVPNITQRCFKAPKQSIKEKPSTWSAPSKYQQTITQMNPFHAIYHPESEDGDENLMTDEDTEPKYVQSPVGRKRRRIAVEESEKPIASTAKRRKSARTGTVPESQNHEENYEMKSSAIETNKRPSKPQTPATLMPPPVTPRTWRKREIPSSQSPADTPLSTQSRRSTRHYSRSPLKERSTNAIIPAASTKKGTLWPRKLEVEDSMENAEEDSPILVRFKAIPEPTPQNSEPDSAEDEPPQQPPTATVAGWRSSGEVPDSSQLSSSEVKHSSPAVVSKSTKAIVDSDFEEDDEDVENESMGSCFGTPPALQLRLSEPADILKSDPASSDGPKWDGAITQQGSPTASITNPERSEDENPSKQEDLKNEAEDVLSTPPNLRSDSASASAQLFSDLHRATQPGRLQTDSQFENAWHTYHPPSSPQPPSSSILSPSPPSPTPPPPETIPTQLLSPPTASRLSRPVPPSQATTTDITQPSSHKTPYSSSLAFPSSPPPMPPPLSSPLESRKVESWGGYQWDGVRLTDSQLLPESLMNDSYIGPPLGGWDLSQEEEED